FEGERRGLRNPDFADDLQAGQNVDERLGVVSGRRFGAGHLRAEINGELHSAVRLRGALRFGLCARLADCDRELYQTAFGAPEFGASPSGGKARRPRPAALTRLSELWRHYERGSGRITRGSFIDLEA